MLCIDNEVLKARCLVGKCMHMFVMCFSLLVLSFALYWQVWDRRTLSERDPKPVGILAGHSNGITFVDSKVGY